MSAPSALRYGALNMPLIQRWLALSPAEDAPFLAVNLMRYRPRAEYADGRATTLTGRQADDVYTPLGPLAAVGARLIFAADVLEQPAGEPGFHRVAIVRYPTRASFLEMERREDFQELHVHKDAGMEFTIIFAAQPPAAAPAPQRQGALVLRLRRFADGAAPDPDPEGVAPLLALAPEGVIVGDERRWDEARIEQVAPGALPALGAQGGVEEQILTVLSPLLDDLSAAADADADAGADAARPR